MSDDKPQYGERADYGLNAGKDPRKPKEPIQTINVNGEQVPVPGPGVYDVKQGDITLARVVFEKPKDPWWVSFAATLVIVGVIGFVGSLLVPLTIAAWRWATGGW